MRLIMSVVCCSVTAAAIADDTQQEAVSKSDTAAGTAEGIEWFETHIRPVLVEHCYECHSSKSKVVQGGLRLDTARALQAGGDSGPVIATDQPSDSLLLSALRYESYEMPPTGKLPDETIAHFERWIALGTPDPRFDSENATVTTEDTQVVEDHWAFQQPVRHEAPTALDDNWSRTDVDRFVLAGLRSAGIAPSTEASDRTLLRRVYYDLTGLPPTAEQLESFLADSSDSNYENIVDSLLASEQFGERWGRYWLDVARYADTKGYVLGEKRDYKSAYRYRDWVVECFNSDRPYDDFVRAQIAADRLGNEADKVALGFLTLGPRFVNKRHHIINDRIDVVSRGLMGLTVVCARCHDHKYDPISTADYYALYGVFSSSDEKRPDDAPPVLTDKDKPTNAAIFVRGDPKNPGAIVERHFLTCLSSGDPIPFQDGSGRRELSDAIANQDNPLTARVWVNRVWGNLFGRGIVATTSDFGVRGDKPTHPELLDWLACTFVDEGWSTKKLVRRLVLSSVYRQSSDDRDDCLTLDPENALLWKMNRRRLDLEALRDSLLFAGGHLDLSLGGPSVELTEAPYPTRRSIYGFIERQNMPSFFRTFDFANPNAHSGGRPHTVTPQRALYLMNSPFILQQAQQVAARSSQFSPRDAIDEPLDQDATTTRLRRLFRFALSRNPTAEEAVWAMEFLRGDFTEQGESSWRGSEGIQEALPPALSNWEQLAHSLLMSNEFVFLD